MNTSIDKILQLLGATYLRTNLLEEEIERLQNRIKELEKQLEPPEKEAKEEK